jgi:3-oxoacyl-[acyl-carrier-protein] synthase-1
MPSHPITAFSVCCALGFSKAEVSSKLRAGQSGLARCAAFEIDTFVGAVPGALPALPARLRNYDTRTARIAFAALAEVAPAIERARRRWGSERIAIVLGGSTAGLASTEHAYREYERHGRMPSWWSAAEQHDFGAVLLVLRALTGIEGPSYLVSTACSSSGKAIAAAGRLLASGRADAVLTGGVDSLCELTLRGFQSLGILSPEPCRPFSRAPTGINIGEGAALLLLEREGDAAHALLGAGESADAYHMTAPHPEGAGAEIAIRGALAAAGLDAVGHVNTHGTGTEQNDRAEALALGRVLGAATPALSTKGYTGHALGAAGAIEAALSLLCLEGGFLPSNGAHEPADFGIDVVHALRALPVGPVLSNSFAFGGSNVSLVFGAPV